VACDFGIFRQIVIGHLNVHSLLLILVHVFKMTAQNSALGEHLGAMSAAVWFGASVLSEVDCHVAALSECAATAFYHAFKCSLESVGGWVHHSDGLAH